MNEELFIQLESVAKDKELFYEFLFLVGVFEFTLLWLGDFE